MRQWSHSAEPGAPLFHLTHRASAKTAPLFHVTQSCDTAQPNLGQMTARKFHGKQSVARMSANMFHLTHGAPALAATMFHVTQLPETAQQRLELRSEP